ncbi:hypothetical protein TWF718_009190 [Orbilia javanica]|uniref:Uncharacterized protein n=1 Tax=Orbilia javanica TaxID=47235 RepID=A0AAN8NSJ2_9PEZI
MPTTTGSEEHPSGGEILAGHDIVGFERNTEPPTETRLIPLLSLKGRTAVVTGGSKGIGAAVVEGLAEAGANVALWYKSSSDAIKRAEKIAKAHGAKPIKSTSPTKKT